VPTIAEIIAAKKAAAAGKALAAPQAAPVDVALEAAIDRIDPPSVGKRRAGMVLSASAPLPQADIAEKAHHSELRSLSRSKGEAVPMVPADADKETQTWHAALNSFETQLCVMRDPNEPEVIWLALQAHRPELPPILLHRLPWILCEHPATPREENAPY